MEMYAVMERYLQTVSPHKKGYAQEIFRIRFLQTSSIANLAIDKITSADIANYRDLRLNQSARNSSNKISPATVRLELNLLSAIFNEARKEWKLCEVNPVEDVRKPKVPRGRERRLSRSEERRIENYCATYSNPELHCIVTIALETAMRQGELLGLTWKNINLQSGIAHLPDTKNGTSRDVPLSIKARKVLLDLKNKRLLIRLDEKLLKKDKVFTYNASGLKTAWRQMMIKLGIEDLKYHDLRHEAISRLFELGSLNMVEVATISGHCSMNMLKRYMKRNTCRVSQKTMKSRHKTLSKWYQHLL